MEQPTQIVVTNETQWTELWKKHSGQVQPSKPAPKINFNQESVIFVSLGQKKSGGYSVEITDVQIVDGKPEIKVRTRSPKPGGMQLQALTNPFHIVAVRRITASAKFKIDPTP